MAALLCLPATTAATSGAESIEVAPVWSGHAVDFDIVTTDGYQYVGFYDAKRRMTVGQRRLESSEWVFATLPSRVGWDSHNGIVLAVDAKGHVHVSGNMHHRRLIYFRSARPHDVTTLGRARMVGNREKRVTYPRFVRTADGELYFLYRDGAVGSSARILNRYDARSETWVRVSDRPLFDGLGRTSVYLSGPFLGPDDGFHLVWVWRDTPYGSTNHSISYARSRNFVDWETVDGEPLPLPITPETIAARVDPVRSGEGLAGIAFGVGWDGQRRPVVCYSKYGPEGFSQLFNARWEDGAWTVRQTSDFRYRWDLDRTGSLAWDLSFAPVSVDAEGRLVQRFEHIEAGRGTWILDRETLTPIGRLPEPALFESLRQVESDIAGMEVRPFTFDRQNRYFLRWETLPIDRDRKRRGPHPPASMLRVYRAPGDEASDGVETARRADATQSTRDAPCEPDSELERCLPDLAALEADGARIGAIRIRIGEVFGQEEIQRYAAVYRTINRLHVDTRESVIRSQILFAPGDPLLVRKLEETERLLRSRRYLYDAEVRPLAYRDGVVDLEVAVRDVWTLRGGASLSRSGGENATRFDIQDLNFLGTGSDVGIEYRENVDRAETAYHFRNKHLLGSRFQVEGLLSDNSDGERQLVKLIRPFFALDSRWSTGLTLLRDDRIDSFFELGEKTAEFRTRFDLFEAWWGWSRGLVDGRVWRFRTGYTYNGNTFSEAAGRVAPPELPPDRIQSFPWIDVEYLEDRFVEIHNQDQLARTEDVLLGKRFQARLGYSAESFGATEDRLLLGSSAGFGIKPATATLLLSDLGIGARWDGDDIESFVADATVRFFWRNWQRHLFLVEVQGNAARNLDAERQLLLGGDSGLRGYPLRFQSGDRRFLVKIEQRFFSNREILKIAHVGAAAFFDAGRAWFAGSAGAGQDLGILKDVGIGLRISSSRSGLGSVVHLDLAFPLDREGGIDAVQWLVSTKKTL